MMSELEVSAAHEVGPRVAKYGVAIWRGLVSEKVTSAFIEPVLKNAANKRLYISKKFGVISPNILSPEVQEACFVQEMKDVFWGMCPGGWRHHVSEIYLTGPRILPHLWHQDATAETKGYDVFTWVAGTPCGIDQPGLSFALGNPGRFIGGQEAAEKAASTMEIISPVFKPGDAFFFDIFSLHRTNQEPSMKYSRIAYKLGVQAALR